jgi:hypothetical protein
MAAAALSFFGLIGLALACVGRHRSNQLVPLKKCHDSLSRFSFH